MFCAWAASTETALLGSGPVSVVRGTMYPMELLTADQAATILDVPARTIRRWHQTGRAAPAGLIPSPGRTGQTALYTLHELQPLATEYHARKTRQQDGLDQTPVHA